MGYPGFARYAIGLGVKGEVDELAKGICDDFQYYYENVITLKPFAKEYIEKLVADGIHCHILTGSPHALVDPCLRNNGVNELFENVWSVDDFGLMKSDPELYNTIAKQLGVTLDDIRFFDDNYNVVKTCREIGLEIYAVYDKTTAEYKEEIKAIADRYIDSFEELL